MHGKKLPLSNDVDLLELARATPGASGADLANILNESALLTARQKLSEVTNTQVAAARNKVLFGKERKHLLLDESERKITAYHEAGHALIASLLPHADPIDRVSIMPRGASLGATYFLPLRDKHLHKRQELLDQLSVLLGGRAAEELFLADISSGAQMDLRQATHLVRKMVCEWGMVESLGPVSYEREYSEATAAQIDKQVQRLLSDAYARTQQLLQTAADRLESIAAALLSQETLTHRELTALLQNS